MLEVRAPFVTELDETRTWTLDDLKAATGTVRAAPAPSSSFRLPTTPRPCSRRSQTGQPLADDARQQTLKLAGSLTNAYDRASLRITANVAPATHGESKARGARQRRRLGAFQRFALKDAPLTYVPTATTSGSATTLERAGQRRALEGGPRALRARPARPRVRRAHRRRRASRWSSSATAQTGARLPTGSENVARPLPGRPRPARARSKAGKLTLLLSPPLGVKSVTNPFPATGAADPETLDRARDNAPLTVLTFDRIVSLQDFEDFAAPSPASARRRRPGSGTGERGSST